MSEPEMKIDDSGPAMTPTEKDTQAAREIACEHTGHKGRCALAEEIESALTAARAEERETAAVACERVAGRLCGNLLEAAAAVECAAAIRARAPTAPPGATAGRA